MRFELFVAARYLRARRRQAVVGLVTAISVVGVAAGVAALIVAPGLYGQVLISRGATSGGALIKGIVPADELRVGNLLQTTKQGSFAELAPVRGGTEAEGSEAGTQVPESGPGAAGVLETPPIVIGNELALTLGAQVGDTLLVTSPQGDLTPLGLVPRYQRFRVAGIFASGFYQYDSSYAFMRLGDAQRLFSEPDIVSVLSFRIDDLYRAQEVGRALEQAAGPGFQATNWMEQNRELFRALKLEQVVTFIVLALIVVVAALNILIALTMMVMEKTKDIAVLMSFGVSSAQVRRIFLLQGLLISAIGSVLGLILGYAGSLL